MSWGWHFLQQSHLGFTELTMMGQIFGPALIINSFAFTPQLTIAEQMTGDVTRVGCTRRFVFKSANNLKKLITWYWFIACWEMGTTKKCINNDLLTPKTTIIFNTYPTNIGTHIANKNTKSWSRGRGQYKRKWVHEFIGLTSCRLWWDVLVFVTG